VYNQHPEITFSTISAIQYSIPKLVYDECSGSTRKYPNNTGFRLW